MKEHHRSGFNDLPVETVVVRFEEDRSRGGDKS